MREQPDDLDMVNVHDAKTNLSKLLARVEAGEEIIISRAGTPIARLVPERPMSNWDIIVGSMKGEIWVADDFDEPDPDIERLFGYR